MTPSIYQEHPTMVLEQTPVTVNINTINPFDSNTNMSTMILLIAKEMNKTVRI